MFWSLWQELQAVNSQRDKSHTSNLSTTSKYKPVGRYLAVGMKPNKCIWRIRLEHEPHQSQPAMATKQWTLHHHCYIRPAAAQNDWLSCALTAQATSLDARWQEFRDGNRFIQHGFATWIRETRTLRCDGSLSWGLLMCKAGHGSGLHAARALPDAQWKSSKAVGKEGW